MAIDHLRLETLVEIPAPVKLELLNRAALSSYGIENPRHTPPGGEDGHYLGQYLWDSCYSIMVFAENGFMKEAHEEFDSLLETQNPITGFMPNMARTVKRLKILDAEWRYFTNDLYSDYTQPPMLAQAALAIYEGYVQSGEAEKGIEFITENYGKLTQAYDYLKNYRQNSPTDPLVGNIHSNETGMDSAAEFDFSKRRLRRNGVETSIIVNAVNPVLDYIGALSLNRANYKVGWDVNKIRKHFWVNHVMFNCKYVENLYCMSDIAEIASNENDHYDFKKLARSVEDQIVKDMWVPKNGEMPAAFYSLDRGKHIPEVGVSSLYPVLLPNLPISKLAACLDLMESEFNTPFPLPTVSTKSRNYDPHYREKWIMWRGPVWQWPNRDIVRGLRMQSFRDLPHDLIIRCLAIANHIEERSEYLVTKNGPYENHDPITGEGFRVRNFAGAANGWPLVKSDVKVR